MANRFRIPVPVPRHVNLMTDCMAYLLNPDFEKTICPQRVVK